MDDPQVSPAVEQVGGEGVAQRMGVRRHRRTGVDDPPHVARPSRFPRWLRNTAPGGLWGVARSAQPWVEPRTEHLRAPSMNGHPSLLVTLAGHRDGSAREVHAFALEPAELGDP